MERITLLMHDAACFYAGRPMLPDAECDCHWLPSIAAARTVPQYRHASIVKRGDQFTADGIVVATVLRRSVTHGWVDIHCTSFGGYEWTKRMPKGIPMWWRHVAAAQGEA